MATLIGYTDSIQTCECCGKTNLKGTFCLEINGIELYYGSTCALKSHGINEEDQINSLNKFKLSNKINELIDLRINSLYNKTIEKKILKALNIEISKDGIIRDKKISILLPHLDKMKIDYTFFDIDNLYVLRFGGKTINLWN